MTINKETAGLNSNILSKRFEDLRDFLKTEVASGLMLIVFSVCAIVLSNSDFSSYYYFVKDSYLTISVAGLHLSETVHHWVNDGLMSIFFLVIGLELKREMINGQLSSFDKILLPGVAALGGMVVPALLYLYINQNQPLATS